MDEAFPQRLVLDVRQGGRYTVFGQVTSAKDGSLQLNDGSGTIGLSNLSIPLTGLVEVRGICERTGWLEVKSHVVFADESFDHAEYAKAVGIITRGDSDFAAWTVPQTPQ